MRYFKPYMISNMHTISIHDITNNKYPFIFLDTNCIKEITTKSGTDETIPVWFSMMG